MDADFPETGQSLNRLAVALGVLTLESGQGPGVGERGALPLLDTIRFARVRDLERGKPGS